MKSADFLDLLQKELDLDSDNKLAQALSMERTRISMYRTGRREFDILTCVAVADILKMDVQFVIGSIEAARAKRKDERAVWQFIANRAKKASAAAASGVAVLAGCLVSPAAEAAAVSAASGSPSVWAYALTLYIKLNRGCRRLAGLPVQNAQPASRVAPPRSITPICEPNFAVS